MVARTPFKHARRKRTLIALFSSYAPHSCQEAKIGHAPSPVEGRARPCIIKSPCRSEKSPVKTPALRHFQIRGHRPCRPTLRKIRHEDYRFTVTLSAHAPTSGSACKLNSRAPRRSRTGSAVDGYVARTSLQPRELPLDHSADDPHVPDEFAGDGDLSTVRVLPVGDERLVPSPVPLVAFPCLGLNLR